ncbi:hypothetical protein OVY01_00715 [Robbsia sp. Bb-Pol-6]|uniref:Uncharacterized protein n=1 Tax=Robbsia betulipollinis TaxID=2981849 RepID=A0ABT3ZGY5_9BURK|nr:hypothetical protein [Robbsia betulipollinis]
MDQSIKKQLTVKTPPPQNTFTTALPPQTSSSITTYRTTNAFETAIKMTTRFSSLKYYPDNKTYQDKSGHEGSRFWLAAGLRQPSRSDATRRVR